MDPEPDGAPDVADDAEEQVQRLSRPLSEVQRARGDCGDHRVGHRGGPPRPGHALYYTGQAKWTSTVTSRLLLEAGYSTNVEYLYIGYQPGVQKERGSPEWFNTIGKSDLIALGRMTPFRYWDGPRPDSASTRRQHVISTAASVRHRQPHLQGRFNWTFGDYVLEYDINGDLVQLYRNGVPGLGARLQHAGPRERVPERQPRDVRAGCLDDQPHDVQRGRPLRAVRRPDQGSGRRLRPLRAGAHLRRGDRPAELVRRRAAPRRVVRPVRQRPDGAQGAPSAGTWPARRPASAQRYNPLQIQTDTRTWRDANGDNIAQDSEIGAEQQRRVRSAGADDPARSRTSSASTTCEYTAAIQHELIRGLSVTRLLVPPQHAQQRLTQTSMVLDAGRLHRRQRGQPARRLDHPGLQPGSGQARPTSTGSTSTRPTPTCGAAPTTAFEVGVQRARRGRPVLRRLDDRSRIIDHCDELRSRATLAGRQHRGDRGQQLAQPKSDYHFCDQSELDMPFLHEFKLAGSYTLPWDIQANVALQSYNGGRYLHALEHRADHAVRGQLRRTVPPGELVIPNHDAGGRTTLDLTPPGSEFYERQNQLDMGFRKIFRVRPLPALRPGRHLQHRSTRPT